MKGAEKKRGIERVDGAAAKWRGPTRGAADRLAAEISERHHKFLYQNSNGGYPGTEVIYFFSEKKKKKNPRG